MANNKRWTMSREDLEIFALSLLSNDILIKKTEDIAEAIQKDTEAHSDNSKKFKWEVSKEITGDRTTFRVGSNSHGSARYEFFSGALFNSANKNRD